MANIHYKIEPKPRDNDFEGVENLGRFVSQLDIFAKIGDSIAGYLNATVIDTKLVEEKGLLRELIECSDDIEDTLKCLYWNQINNHNNVWHSSGFATDVMETFESNGMSSSLKGGRVGNGKILVIDRLRVHDEYQNQGIGQSLLQQLYRCERLAPLMFLKASPIRKIGKSLTFSERLDEEKRLEKFYGHYGFSAIGGTPNMVTTMARFRYHVEATLDTKSLERLQGRSSASYGKSMSI